MQVTIIRLLLVGLIVLAGVLFTGDRLPSSVAEDEADQESEEPPPQTFQELIQDPDNLDFIEEAERELENVVNTAKGWSDFKIGKYASSYILEISSSDEAWADRRILERLAPRTFPPILKLLGDSKLYERLVTPTGEIDELPESPFNRACDLLGDSPPAEAVPVLAPFLDHSSEYIRRDAALAIAKTGAASIAPHVRKAFGDSDEFVRSAALIGLDWALGRDDLAPVVANELFPDVKRLLDKGFNDDEAADILFRFDSKNSQDYFLSAEVFRPDTPIIHEVLETLANHKASVPRERILALISGLEAAKLEYPRTYALGEALRLLGQQQDPKDRAFLAKRMRHAEDRVAEGASSGLLASHGLEDFEERMRKAEEKAGYQSLPKEQRYYTAVFRCDAEIRNGGLAQYFSNSSGDHWKDVIAGLEAMDAAEHLKILKQALEIFGKKGPSTDRERRQDELGTLYRKNDALFDQLDTAYYENPEVLYALATKYVLSNPDRFR